MTVITRSSRIKLSTRVRQIASLLDVPVNERSDLKWTVNLPLKKQPWQIGLICGPSGCGKSTIADELFGDRVIRDLEWPADRSILDSFPEGMGAQEIVGLLTAVGLGSAPAWLRPHQVLSTGEQFRATMARALAEAGDADPLVVDEFTSVVDRQVAKVCSHAIQKTVRKRGQQLVAVSCHDDIVEWLQPDWIYQPELGEFTWRCLQRRPTLTLDVCPVDRTVWQVFRRHHYLSANLPSGPGCQAYGGFVNGKCVAFAWVAGVPHPSPTARSIRRVRRLVVLPDWQGLGIGTRLEEHLAQRYTEHGFRFRSVVSHPGMVRYYLRSPRWRVERRPKDVATLRMLNSGRTANRSLAAHQADPRQLLTWAFAYVPPAGTRRRRRVGAL